MKSKKMMVSMSEIFDDDFFAEREAVRAEAQQIHETVVQRLKKISRSADELIVNVERESNKRTREKSE